MASITQSQYNVSKQPFRNRSVRVNLLNFDFQTISTFEGNLIEGNLTSDSTSNMRNTCDLTLVVTDSSFNIQAEGKIWLDRLVQIYIGVDDIHLGETAWTNKGIFIINQPTYEYNAATKTLQFQAIDMFGLLTGLRNGYLTDDYTIPQGSNVRQVIIAILGQNKMNRYLVSECANTDGSIQAVPYDMKYTAGQAWSDVLADLQDILPNYQMYFDVDGIFHYEAIPYKANEPIRMDDDIWKENVISETISYDFESIKNSVKVLGRTHDISHYPSNISVSGANINLTIASVSGLSQYLLIGFTLTSNINGNINLQVNSFGLRPLVNERNNYITSLSANTYYVAQWNGNSWLFLGHLQAQGEFKDNDANSPFFVGASAGEIKIVLSGDDYSNITSDALAQERAKWEVYQRCRMNDTVNITTVPIYWSEVNWMVAYTPLGGNSPSQYLIKSISTNLAVDGTQTYTLAKFYPYYY